MCIYIYVYTYIYSYVSSLVHACLFVIYNKQTLPTTVNNNYSVPTELNITLGGRS